jgi:hypothetical protein
MKPRCVLGIQSPSLGGLGGGGSVEDILQGGRLLTLLGFGTTLATCFVRAMW